MTAGPRSGCGPPAPDDAGSGATRSVTPYAAQEQVDLAPTPSAGTKRWVTQISTHALRDSTTSYGSYFGREALKTFRAAEAA